MEEQQDRGTEQAGGSDLIHARAAEVLASTAPEGDYYANAIWGRDFAAAYERDTAAYFIIDVRTREDYCRGHIEGAVHMDFSRWADRENLALIPEEKKVTVVCENGCKSAQVSAGLRLLGYDASIIRTGMNGWTRTVHTEPTVAALESASAPVQRLEAQACAPAPEDVSFGGVSVEAYELIAGLLGDQFARTPVAGDAPYHVISPDRLRSGLENGGSDYYLVDVREDFEYEGVGHIDGARWLDFNAAAVPENLALLPRDRRIVTICYTGNMAAQLSTVLRLLGYEAVVLDLGMAGWTRSPTTQSYLKDILEADRPVTVLGDEECGRGDS